MRKVLVANYKYFSGFHAKNGGLSFFKKCDTTQNMVKGTVPPKEMYIHENQ